MIANRSAAVLALFLTLGATTGAAQTETWPNLDQLLLSTLSNTGAMESALWLPDDADPTRASAALGIAYVHIPGSAGSVSLGAALFAKGATGWAPERPVTGLFGFSPRDHRFLADRIELTTTMAGPDDPRCCPTQPARWSIDRATGQAQRLD